MKVDPIKYLITCSFKCQMNNFKEIMQEGKYWLWIMKTKTSKISQQNQWKKVFTSVKFTKDKFYCKNHWKKFNEVKITASFSENQFRKIIKDLPKALYEKSQISEDEFKSLFQKYHINIHNWWTMSNLKIWIKTSFRHGRKIQSKNLPQENTSKLIFEEEKLRNSLIHYN